MKIKNIFNKRVLIYTFAVLTVFYYFTGIRTYETDKITLDNNGNKIVLIGMVHQAPNTFYKEITKNVKNYKNRGYKYYYEGVLGTPEEVEQLNKIIGAIDNVKDRDYGFDKQENHNELRKGKRSDITVDELIEDLKKEKVYIKTEIKEYKQTNKTSEFKIFLNRFWLRFCYRYNDFIGFQNEGLYKVLIEKRNDKLIQTIDTKHNSVVTYGQLHLEDIINKLTKKGYKVIKKEKIKVF